MAKSLLDSLLDSVFDEKWIGKRGEKLTERELKLVNLFGRKGITLRNVYLPKNNGETSEIDILYITQKGIFVFESKNYSGWIFGNEHSQYWTASLPNRQKNRFYNPIAQNRTHIKWLKSYVGENIPMFSIIIFSERCELKQITVESPDIKVIQRDRTYATVRSIWDSVPDILPETDVAGLYEKLKPLTKADKATKLAHIENIQAKYTEKPKGTCSVSDESELSVPLHSETESVLCPRCGKELILRTAKNGPNAGRQFYGCTGFPKCRYTEDIHNS